ncbi:MAG: MerR family transcriptional regulator [Acidobacteria bacterium]|nr:MerR family transcriptional regulator [Acidobacteriota bacterium]
MANPVVPVELPEIPDKLYFRIGEVSRLAGVKPFVLRFWETEFPQLAPKKSGTGHRLYRRKDVETVLEIKRLLYDQRFTIEGARNYLHHRGTAASKASSKNSGRRQKATPAPEAQTDLFRGATPAASIEDIRKELKAILAILG